MIRSILLILVLVTVVGCGRKSANIDKNKLRIDQAKVLADIRKQHDDAIIPPGIELSDDASVSDKNPKP
jgi:hypothetical protein